MIRVDGTVSHLSGSMTELLCDLTRIIKHMKETFSKDVGEDQTREMIALAGMLAFMSDEELNVDKDTREKVLEDFIKRGRGE